MRCFSWKETLTQNFRINDCLICWTIVFFFDTVLSVKTLKLLSMFWLRSKISKSMKLSMDSAWMR
jgi:hypothetical protein